MLERKALSVEFKADEAGTFRATFSTFNVIDRDGDVTLPGAFTDGQEVRIASWGHNWGTLPVGKGVIHADTERAWVDGEFFLETAAGKDTHTTVKALAGLQEWSYGFDVKAYKFGQFAGQDVRFLEGLDVFEVSPVMIGAGINTRTEFVKGSFDSECDQLIALHREFLERAKARSGIREKEGRTLSQANRSRLASYLESLLEIRAGIEKLLEETEPEPKAFDLMEELLKFESGRARRLGVTV